jgi:GNAT superfamily N-acetyltransferase
MKSTPKRSTIYHLEMCNQRDFHPKELPAGLEVKIIRPPQAALNRYFYSAVGAQWQWQDRLGWTTEEWQKYVQRVALQTCVGQMNGRDVGYFELETQDDGNLEIMYFGLLPPYIGMGLGAAFLSAAIQLAWDSPATKRVWVHTCTEDHQHALDNYLKRGFEIFKTETAS